MIPAFAYCVVFWAWAAGFNTAAIIARPTTNIVVVSSLRKTQPLSRNGWGNKRLSPLSLSLSLLSLSFLYRSFWLVLTLCAEMTTTTTTRGTKWGEPLIWWGSIWRRKKRFSFSRSLASRVDFNEKPFNNNNRIQHIDTQTRRHCIEEEKNVAAWVTDD